MKKIFKHFQRLSEDTLLLLITLLGVLITWRVIYIQHGWVNVDSLIYFESARLFSIGEWKQGFTLFQWPLYSLLISAVHRLTNLGIQSSAQILDIIFFAITTFSFGKLIQLAGGDRLTMLCGAFLLLGSAYIVGDILPMLLRDQGFWAAFLTSLVFFIRFYRTNKLSDALLWQVSAIIAMLFRIEAITYLAGVPMLLLFRSEYPLMQRVRQLVIINIIPILSVALIIGVLIAIPSVTLSDFGRLQEAVTIVPRMMTDVVQAFTHKAHIMGEQVLGSYFADYGLMAVMFALAGILIVKIINIISWPVIGIYSLSFINRRSLLPLQQMQPDARKILYWTALIALLNGAVIITLVFILSNRYIISLGLISLIFAAFCLASLMSALGKSSLDQRWQKTLLIILLMVLGLSFIKNLLPKREGFNYEREAVSYLKQQQIPIDKTFFVSPRSVYYAGAPYNERCGDHWKCTIQAIEDGSIFQYDYLLLALEVDESLAEKEAILSSKLPQYVLNKEFYGVKRKKKMMFYMKK